jgi:eukaryotic-like serine/threonine-protein kinase
MVNLHMASDPLIGKQLRNFRIERLLGRGGMAQVYYGWDANLDRPVAIKLIDARFRDLPDYAARFLREAKAVAAWRRPDIVHIYHADQEDGLYYYAMEYLEGCTLTDLIFRYQAQGELMPFGDVLQIGMEVASALDYAHKQGVIHRDVKPGNIMVTIDGRVVLTDFGLALDSQAGSLGEVFGSPHYISPEQARRSSDAVPQSDLYSLGVILYELLTGVVPFDDPSATTVAIQHITMEPPAPRLVNPGLNSQTEAVLLKSLSKLPADRYPTGNDLLTALEAALSAVETGDREIHPALPPPPPGMAVKSPRALSRLSVSDQVAAHGEAGSQPLHPHEEREFGDDLSGTQLDEYRIETRLGAGGMGAIYRAVDVRLNRLAAIKVILTPFRADPDYLMRFEREAQAIARLQHPHIVQLYRYGQAGDMLYMAMQYIDGLDLEKILQGYRADREDMDPADVHNIIRQVCSALDYIHSQGIIHRDIKPANIILDKQCKAVLADFGLALLTEAGTRGMVLGSPHYLSPEQAVSSARVTPQSDLYSVGVILYEIFTGRLPFEADSPLDIAMLHLTTEPTSTRLLRPDLSLALEAVIMKAMSNDPEDRFVSGKDLADALQAAIETTRPVTVSQPLSTRVIPQVFNAYQPASETLPTIVPQDQESASASRSEPPDYAYLPTAEKPEAPARRHRMGLLALPVLAIGICMFFTIFYLATGVIFPRLMAFPQAGWSPATPTLAFPVSSNLQTPTHFRNSPPAPITPTPLTTISDPTQPEIAIPTFTASYTTPEPDPEETYSELTPEPSPSSTPTLTQTFSPTPTLPFSPTFTFTPTATPLPYLAEYKLVLYWKGDELLLLINKATDPFPLVELRIESQKGEFFGDDDLEWTELLKEECLAWTTKAKVDIPRGMKCELVGQINIEKRKAFWPAALKVFYGEQELGECKEKPNTCQLKSEDK